VVGGPRSRTLGELFQYFGVRHTPDLLQIDPESPLAGKTIGETEVGSRYRVRIVGILRSRRRREERITAPDRDTELRSGDGLLVLGLTEDVDVMCAQERLARQPIPKSDRQRWLWELGAAPVLIHPDSTLIGKSLREVKFRSNNKLHVVALHRGREPVDDFLDVPLRSSDNLLVAGSWHRICQLQSHPHEFVVLEMPAEYADIVPSYRRMPVALAILAAMVLLTIFDVVPLVAAVLMATIAAGVTGCLTIQDAYRSIHWSSLVLIAGMLPLADALTTTGGTQVIVDALMSAVGEASPYTMLSVVFFLTAILGLVLSNTASAVLVAPIAIYLAQSLELSPYPFGLAVLIAASAAYSTPISTPVVTLVVEPGRYKFLDFIKVGVPLLFLTYLVTLLVAPLIFPFHAP
jgi:di/tricarboxylate transporter